MRLCWILLLVVIVPTASGFAGDDSDQNPLGDFARGPRKKNAASQAMIDDDNLPQVMQQAESGRGFKAFLRFLMSGDRENFQGVHPRRHLQPPFHFACEVAASAESRTGGTAASRCHQTCGASDD